jgi:tetratricopeptide (TPR) repeat protein
MAGLAFALVVSASPMARAQLHAPQQTQPPGPAAPLTTQSVEAQLAGDPSKALALAEEAIKADPRDPWGYYNRGSALQSLRRTDEAVASFRDAEQRFPEVNTWGRSVAIWGQANALAQAGRCADAVPLYERYAAFVERVDSAAAALARQYARSCNTQPPAK